MKLSIVVAAAKNNVIGINNQLPWHIPDDLRHFKDLTIGKTIIMGRKTHDSIGYALPKRINIVVSSEVKEDKNNLFFVDSVSKALDTASKYNKRKLDEIFIIGGINLFAETLPLINTIYLTRIDKDIEGDTYLPDNFLNGFELQESKLPRYDDELECTYQFLKYIRPN